MDPQTAFAIEDDAEKTPNLKVRFASASWHPWRLADSVDNDLNRHGP